jgi:exonuclease-1
MGRRLIALLRERGLPFFVAPYEADAQLTFLVLHGYCSAAISEDSDLLAYGCPHTIFKLDRTGHGRLISHENLQSAEQNGRPLFDGGRPDEWREWREVRQATAAVSHLAA